MTKRILTFVTALVLAVGAWADDSEAVKLSGGYNYTTSGQTRMAISQWASYALTGNNSYNVSDYKACRVEYTDLVGDIRIMATNGGSDADKVEEFESLTTSGTTCTLTFNQSSYSGKTSTIKLYLNATGSTNLVTLSKAYLVKNDDTEVELTEGKSAGWGVDFGYNGMVSFSGWGNIEMDKKDVATGTYHLYTFNFNENTSGEGKVSVQVNYTDGASASVKIPASASTFENAVTGNSIDKIILSDNGNAVSIDYSSITRTVKDISYASTTLYSGTQEMNNLYWTQLTVDKDKFANVHVGDIIKFTMTTTNEDSPKLSVVDGSGNGYSDIALPKEKTGYEFSYIIPSETILTLLQSAGLNLRGDKLTITQIDLQSQPNATVSAAKYATFTTPAAIDFSQTAGLTAYIAKKSGDKIALTEVTKVEANKAVILYADVDAATNYTLVTTDETTDDVSANELKVSDGSVTGDASTIYVLANGNNGVGFYLLKSGSTVTAGKAYLQITSSSSAPAREYIGFGDGNTTEMEQIFREASTDSIYYTLHGLRVDKPNKGLYIVNGKKVIIK